MKKQSYKHWILAFLLSMPVAGQAQSFNSIIRGVKETVNEKLGGKNVSSVVGTWKYAGVDCKLESDNLLAKAGSVVAEAKVEDEVEKWVSKLGFKEGSVYTFHEDGTYTVSYKGKDSKGKYTYDATTQQLIFKSGIVNLKPTVSRAGTGTISLLLDAGILLKASQATAKLTSTLKKPDTKTAIANSLLEKYDGMKIGIQLEKVEDKK